MKCVCVVQNHNMNSIIVGRIICRAFDKQGTAFHKGFKREWGQLIYGENPNINILFT